jgi:hypothetical protein
MARHHSSDNINMRPYLVWRASIKGTVQWHRGRGPRFRPQFS